MIPDLFVILAETPPSTPAQGLGSMLIPFICIGVIFYFLILRPQQKRQRDLDALLGALKTGDKVVTNSGIHGIIANLKEGKTLILKIADTVKIEIDKAAISAVEKSSETSAPAAS